MEESDATPQLVLDHQGNPEWKCAVCNFRDGDRSTVEQHRGLAHGRSVVSLLHAVHRCDVCAFAAGTKRHVQLHIDSAHGGRGGITSSCEGQSPGAPQAGGGAGPAPVPGSAAVNRTFTCRVCPFKTSRRSLLKQHFAHHTPRLDCLFKCMACPYYVNTKIELFEHLSVHGVRVPPSIRQSLEGQHQQRQQQQVQQQQQQQQQQLQQQQLQPPPRQQGEGPSIFQCGSCPFESRNRTKILHHRQFHRPRGLAFKCPQCSYNVTRRHLLAQHIKVHGLPPDTLEQIFGSNGMTASLSNGEGSRERSDSPSPSLTITPINCSGVMDISSQVKDTHMPTGADFLPILPDADTEGLADVPMVWTSKGDRFFKMFKCRWCPHINLRKTNVQDHEKMHLPNNGCGDPRPEGSIKCPYCSYVSVNVSVITSHVKVHEGILGKIHAFVDGNKSDEEQIHRLKSQAMMQSLLHKAAESSRESSASARDEKLLYCCQHCPARFFAEKEILIHSRFHGAKFNLTFTCDKCDYGVRQQPHLLAHVKVHSLEYQENTRILLNQFKNALLYPPIPGLSTPTSANSSPEKDPAKEAAVIVKDAAGITRFKCSLCPSTFSKQITLQYHQSLHGANNPHKCHRCTYAAKTQDALAQHLALHDKTDKERDDTSKMEEKPVEATPVAHVNPPTAAPDPLQPPIKLKFIGLKSNISTSNMNGSDAKSGIPKKQFKYYVEEQIPLSGVDLLRHKTQMEQQQLPRVDTEDAKSQSGKNSSKSSSASRVTKDEDEEAKRHGDSTLHYPLHVDKSSGKTREKRYKCKLCPSAFEKVDQFNVHANLHGANHKYKCRICDYAVKFYANFNMHINRHKYNERVEHKKNGKQLASDNDSKYEPLIQHTEDSEVETREGSVEQSAELTTAEKQHILLQSKKGIDPKPKEDESKRVFYCQFCPYANVRRDAVDSHSLRHIANGGKGLYRCNFCDYIASQPNFIKEHTKVHFKPFKYVVPEGYVRHDQQDLFSVDLVTEDQPEYKHDKMNVFSHKNGVFRPIYKPTKDSSVVQEKDTSNKENAQENFEELNKLADPVSRSGIVIDFVSGEVVDAPSEYIITLKPTKAKHRDSGAEADFMRPPSKRRAVDEKHTEMDTSSENGGAKASEYVGNVMENGAMAEPKDTSENASVTSAKKTKETPNFLGFESSSIAVTAIGK